MDWSELVARRLKEARARAGLSQRRLGILAGIHEDSASPRINQYERAKHQPDAQTLDRIGKVVGAPLAYFFTADDRMAALLVTLHRMNRVQLAKVAKFADSLSRTARS